MVMLELLAIRKSFSGLAILRGASLSVRSGERLVCFGENGSGKSTLLQVAAGVIDAESGTRRLSVPFGFAAEKPDLPEHLAVGEWLSLIASLKGLRELGPLPFGVAAFTRQRSSSLSLGERQRVSLASAWLGDPALLILDEPTNGLDSDSQAELSQRLRSATALIATHDRPFAAAIATRTLTLEAGVIPSAPG